MIVLTEYIIPCLYCEDALEHVAIFRDEETGQESSERVRVPHLCETMKSIYEEGKGTPATTFLLAQRGRRQAMGIE